MHRTAPLKTHRCRRQRRTCFAAHAEVGAHCPRPRAQECLLLFGLTHTRTPDPATAAAIYAADVERCVKHAADAGGVSAVLSL
jgi:hypothetical protein